jgi:EmrB/QacA subfamily drug resistance transporter
VSQTTAKPIPDHDVPLTREQILVTIGVLAAIAVAALDFTVVGTAMPTIIGQLGGLGSYSWVFTAYLLTSTTTVPLYARLADMYGRKPVFLFGLTVFVAGSVLCATSGSMLALIVWRAVQGLGAGALQPISFTIVGDIFTPRQRAKMQGVFSAVWGVSAVIGPAIGAIITTTVGWPWVFMINLPVGIVAGLIIWFVFHETFERHRQQIDWLGAALLTGSVVLLLFAVSEGGQLFGWTSPIVIAMFVGAAALFAAFVADVRRAPAPLIDLHLVREPLVRVALGISILAGVVMFGQTTYVPPMIQGVLGGSALEAGAAVSAMSIGWPIASVIAGRILLRTRARPIVLAGVGAVLAGSLLLTQLDAVRTLPFAMLACFVTGVGMGLMSTTLLVVIQGAVEWNRRAVATGLVQFSRTIGGSVGVGIMGGVLAAFVGAASSAILDPLQRGNVASDAAAAARSSLAAGLDVTYWLMAVCALVAFALAIRAMPDVALGHELAPAPARSVRADAA